MNRYGNSYTSYGDDGYEYHNADGSKYAVNSDGSSVYDPGTSGKGTKWPRSPDGAKHYIHEEECPESYAAEYQNERYEYGRSVEDCEVAFHRSYTPHYEPPTLPPAPRKRQTSRCSRPVGPGGYQYTSSQVHESHYEEEDSWGKQTVHTSERKEKEVYVQYHTRRPPSPPPRNVTRVVHHSSKGEKEVLYNSPAKVGTDGQVQKIEKVVHIHHHKDPR